MKKETTYIKRYRNKGLLQLNVPIEEEVLREAKRLAKQDGRFLRVYVQTAIEQYNKIKENNE